MQIQMDENVKFMSRNHVERPFENYYSLRPVTTRRTVLPLFQPSVPATVRVNRNTERPLYFPGNRMAPWSGFASNVNTESLLRGQVYAHQVNPLAHYMPNTDSSLYGVHWRFPQSLPNTTQEGFRQMPEEEKHSLLFQGQDAQVGNSKTHQKVRETFIGHGQQTLFNNCSRTCVRDSPCFQK